MERKIADIAGFEMYANQSGTVTIKQTSFTGEEDIVLIHPMHIDQAIKWLQELRDELLAVDEN